MRITRDEMLINICNQVAMRSTCNRLHVGAVISIDGRIISSGYNGNPHGMPHCGPECNPESPCDSTVHAEANAILHAAKYGVSINEATLYCTDSTCIQCAKLIINSGISRFVYLREYRKVEGLKLLTNCGVQVEKYIQPPV